MTESQRIALEAANWLQTLKEQESGASPEFSDWLTRSPRHVEMYVRIAVADALLQTINPDRIAALLKEPAEPESRWSKALNDAVSGFRRHGAVAVFVLCTAVGCGGFGLATILLKPQTEHQEPNHRADVQPAGVRSQRPEGLLVSNRSVDQGTSVTTPDGRCLVTVGPVDGNKVTPSVVIEGLEAKEFKKISVGTRVKLDTSADRYYVDVNRIRGTIVDISIGRFGHQSPQQGHDLAEAVPAASASK
jgi:hypothetical protein